MGNHISAVLEWVWSFKSEEQRRKQESAMQCQWIQNNIKRFQKRIDDKKVTLRTLQRSLHHNQERLEKYRQQHTVTDSDKVEAKHILQEIDKLEKQRSSCYRIIRDVEQLKHGQETQLESLEMWEVLEETGVANSKAPDTDAIVSQWEGAMQSAREQSTELPAAELAFMKTRSNVDWDARLNAYLNEKPQQLTIRVETEPEGAVNRVHQARSLIDMY